MKLSYDIDRSVVVLHEGEGGSNGVWEFDGIDWTNTVPPGASDPPQRSVHALAFNPLRGTVVLFGGEWGGVLGDTWEYDGSEPLNPWTQVTVTSSPDARFLHALTYHAVLRGVLLFGGNNGANRLSDTWLYRWQSAWPDEVCTNSTDDDSDGLVDCADPDCEGLPCSVGTCTGGVCQ